MTVTEKNAWRLETPGAMGWERTARPDDPRKYFMVSADCHVTEGVVWLPYLEEELRPRAPHMEEREDGALFMITEGNRPQMVRSPRGEQQSQSRMEEEDVLRSSRGRTVEQRLEDQDLDGVEVEIVFPTGGLLCWATPDPVFAMAQCRAWNRWAYDQFKDHMRTRILPMALIASGDQEGAMREIAWAAEHGYRGVCLGNAPIYGPTEHGKLQYNDPSFEPMWSLLEETGLVVTFHVSTGKDPRAAGGNGGAIINYVCHSMETTIEPLVHLITSGVFERHPQLQAGLVESGIGFVPWLMETMDYAYKAHHFWVRPVIPDLPSEYFRRNCFATFQEDHVGLMFAEQLDIVDNLLWANDYPHHEGSWPHSAEAIERTMAHLSDESRDGLMRFARRVDELGFHSGWVSDHIAWPYEIESKYPYTPDGSFAPAPDMPWLDPLGTLFFVAGCTERLRLGTTVLILGYRPPVLTAKAVSSLDVVSGGRAILGVGVGWMKEEFEILGMPFDHRGARADEQLELFGVLFSAEKPSYDGRYYTLPPTGFEPKPVNGTVPIWVGGDTEPAFRRAARFGDAFHAAFQPVAEVEAAWKRVCELAAEAGRPDDLRLSVRLYLDPEGSMKPEVSIAGSPQQMVDTIGAWAAIGVDHILLDPVARGGLDGRLAAAERLITEVAPLAE